MSETVAQVPPQTVPETSPPEEVVQPKKQRKILTPEEKAERKAQRDAKKAQKNAAALEEKKKELAELKEREKVLKKEQRKLKPKGENGKGGLGKKNQITKELQDYFEKYIDEETLLEYYDNGKMYVPRPRITSLLGIVIRKKNMNTKMAIKPDEELRALLRLNEDVELTYFQMQKYYAHLEIKK